MQYGTIEDSDFVLKCSWVNKKWRETLTQSCPGLWGTLRFTREGLQKTGFKEKAGIWHQRAGDNLNTLELRGMMPGGAIRIAKSFFPVMDRLKRLDIAVLDADGLHSFANRLVHTCSNLQELAIDGGSCHREKTEGVPLQLHCGFIASGTEKELRTIEVRHVDYRNDNRSPILYPFLANGRIRHIEQFTGRKRLTVFQCRFLMSPPHPIYRLRSLQR